jgi:hypothetical protein
MIDILVIPDTQVVPDSPTEHLVALGNYCVEKKPEVIVHMGDHWDMHSLSSYDVGKKAAENARYKDDIRAGIDAMIEFSLPIDIYNKKKFFQKKRLYNPRKIFLIGNHENRITRYVNDYPVLAGKLSFDDFWLKEYGWEMHDFLEIVDIEGVKFSHYFLNPDSAGRRSFSASIDHQLKTLGFSFVAGHLPGLSLASPRYSLDGKVTRGIVAGSFYLHDFSYQKPPQGNIYWRGALLLKNVSEGNFMLEELPINWLMENYL